MQKKCRYSKLASFVSKYFISFIVFICNEALVSAEFLKHCVLNGGTQRRALPHHQSEENIKLWQSNTQPSRLQL